MARAECCDGETPKRCLLSEFSRIEVIGGGDFGCVYRAVHDADGVEYAVKQMRRPPQSRAELQRHLQEAYALSTVGSPHVLRYYDAWTERSDVNVCTELLTPLRVAVRCFDMEADAWDFVLQLALGLRDIHAMGVAHLDVKPDNILVGPCADLQRYKLADLGLARSLNSVHEDFDGLNDDEGDRRYLCPYLLKGEAPLRLAAADVYSLGVTILEMIGGSTSYIAGRNIKAALATARPFHQIHALIVAMTDGDPSARPGAFDVISWAQPYCGVDAVGLPEIAELRARRSLLQQSLAATAF